MDTTTLSPLPLHSATIENAAILRQFPLRKVLLSVTVTLTFIAFTAIFVLHGYIAWSIARVASVPLQSNPMQAVGLAYEDVVFPSVNGRSMLNGWYIPAAQTDSSKTVIFSHGYGGNREEPWVPIYELAKSVHELDYNALMFDYSYVTPGIAATAGITETEELLGAVRWAKAQGAQHVYVWGFSMGAGIALQAALHQSEIDGMILDSAFLLNSDTLYQNISHFIHLPKYPSIPLIHLLSRWINGVSLQQIPVQAVESHAYDMPILFMHGALDPKAPYKLMEGIARHQTSPESQFMLLPSGDHEMLYRADKNEYLRLTLSFLQLVSASGSNVGAKTAVVPLASSTYVTESNFTNAGSSSITATAAGGESTTDQAK